MPGDADATKRRLLEAAREEFAAYGIAGARVDRIAAAAQANKAQIYHYFESKDGLFNAVFDQVVERTLAEVPIDTDDLAEYAGRLFDGYEADPTVQRLATWHRLERGAGATPIAAVTNSFTAKVDAIARAQRAGKLSKTFAATDLLAIVLQLSGLWSGLTPEFEPAVARHSRAHRRRVVVGAVQAVLSA
jgi:AcrR family transcriptional regulator